MSNNPDSADYRWLVGPDAAEWLRMAAVETDRPEFSPLRLISRLRKELPPSRAQLVAQQAELRRRGRAKFLRADRMFFTRLGLEQATDEWIAAYKAGRFPSDKSVADLCCGIGGDLLGLARRGPAVAVDRDPVTAIIAEANARWLDDATTAGATTAEKDQRHSVHVKIDDVAAFCSAASDLRDLAAWHIDPDRRPAGRRTTKGDLHEPRPEVIAQLLAVNPNGAVKLAPAAALDEPWWHNAEWEWISRGRQCRQLVAWFGTLAQHAGRRRATVIGGNLGKPPVVAASFVGEPNVEYPIASNIGRYVFEPDAAVLAAKLEGALAAKNGLAAVAAGVAYFTADCPVEDGALSCFQVCEVMPYDVKRLKAWLSARRLGRLEVKKRAAPLDPEQIRRDLRTDGDGEATLFVTRTDRGVTTIITQRHV